MRHLLLTAVAACLLAGCAAKVVSSGPRTVVVKAHVQAYGEAQNLAEAECQKVSRHARLNQRPGPTTAEFIYDCID